MFSTRLTYARDKGGLVLPEQALLVFGATAGDAALFGLDGDTHFVQPLQPEHDRIRDLGLSVSPDARGLDRDFSAAVVLIPRARARAQLWIGEAAAHVGDDGLLVVDGNRTDGIDALFKASRERLNDPESVTKAHGRLFWGVPRDDLQELATSAPIIPAEGFRSGPGVFASNRVDPASQALAALLPDDLGGAVADLGAGWGYLSSRVLASDKVTSLDVVECDHIALSAAQDNLNDPRAQFHWADATAWLPSRPLDVVVMNPPFHTGRKGTPELGQAFIRTAAEALGPKGQLWLVANRHLPYEDTLKQLFREVGEAGGTAAFKILRAGRPRNQDRPVSRGRRKD